jgi:hypothetical protein
MRDTNYLFHRFLLFKCLSEVDDVGFKYSDGSGNTLRFMLLKLMFLRWFLRRVCARG